MASVIEYRVPMPLSVDEYKRAQLYMVAKFSKEHTSNGEGIEIVTNKPMKAEEAEIKVDCQYTHKIIHLRKKLPGWIQALLPAKVSALEIHETAWNAYPRTKTTYKSPFLGDQFSISVTTVYLNDKGDTENALDLDKAALGKRKVDIIDIAMEDPEQSKYKEAEDPKLFLSEKTGRGKLEKGWRDTSNPIMTSYKHVSVLVSTWWVGGRIQDYIQSVIRSILLLGHRQAVCWIDEWWNLTMEDIRELEEKTKTELEEQMKETGEDSATSEEGVASPKKKKKNKANEA